MNTQSCCPVEIEITEAPPLSTQQETLLDMHSVLNTLNILLGELQFLELELDDWEVLQPSLKSLEQLVNVLGDRPTILAYLQQISDLRAAITGNIETALAQHPDRATTPDVQEAVANIQSVFNVVEVRVQQLLAREKAPEAWVEVPIEQLQAQFEQVFQAIEKNSKGRYRILHNIAAQGASDYFLTFDIQTPNGRTVLMPPIFEDVMRDLIANARKYTPQGGKIIAGLVQTPDHLKFVVEDTGWGIPVEEIPKVVGFGYRGSNVQHRRTMGGGFGLTKAFFVTKRFQGRMWIRSAAGAGTRITLDLPMPSTVVAGTSERGDSQG
ncbi:ATP-binding protein [Thermosynechococcus sp. HN-54]|uniref:sensor histidine kinase n=1 Tax=Thermosynechococcus sp. HN-54 TaxID=2933959 RepID=UPI00202CC02F|nr:ATP-binding protein [Thermosynechococcus sp. HN-54]URR35544.1 ATP-binding protein [Thermosynechococcus sp. HN-54]